jgi:hypothetical protein
MHYLLKVIKWLKIASLMTPRDTIAPSATVEGMTSKIDATSATRPDPILPHGSMPSLEKI